jgi:hypothetical protein
VVNVHDFFQGGQVFSATFTRQATQRRRLDRLCSRFERIFLGPNATNSFFERSKNVILLPE